MVQLKLSVMRLRLFMALSVLVLAAQAAEKSRPLFSDWLHQTTATGLPKARLTGGPAYGYDELEEEIGCLRATKFDGCRYIGCHNYCSGPPGVFCHRPSTQCGAKKHRQVHFTCAREEGEYKHKSHKFLGGSEADIGYCEITFNVLAGDQRGVDGSLPVGKNVTQWGTFIATCYLNKGADLCGHPFCDEMVITAEGPTYSATFVASHSNPADPPFCQAGPSGGRFDVSDSNANSWDEEFISPQAPSDKNIPSKAGKASVAQYDDNGPDGSGIEVIGVGPEGPGVPYDNGPEGRVFLGEALIFSGPMRVTSRKYNLKTDQHGWFELVYSWRVARDDNYVPVSVPASAAEGLFFVKPYGANLKFSKAREGSYKPFDEGPAGEEYKPVGYEDRY